MTDRASGQVVLKSGRERSLLRRHPWVFSRALASTGRIEANGQTVEVKGADHTWLARGAFSAASQIRVRVWTFDQAEPVDETFFRRRLEQALALRAALPGPPDYTAVRLVNAESDGLPGLVVDRYGPYLGCQFLAAGAEYWKPVVIKLLEELIKPAGIYERSDVEVRHKEDLPPAAGPLAGGALTGPVEIREGPARFLVDLDTGHKTGFYLDQRDNRALVRALAAGREVLDCFAYTGAFGIQALYGGARQVTCVESSETALARAQEHARLNGFSDQQSDYVCGDVFSYLRTCRDSRRRFDLVVLDPPKFAGTAGRVQAAARGYKDINLLALKLIRPGGLLVTFSCSGHVDPDLFWKIVAGAAADAHRPVQVTHRLGPSPDHPVSLAFPEGNYLKGLVCRVG